ncbi:2-oxo-4-hydroxy-4-carboxy-5-ureidoimidazoline decarboxylase [Variovorax sp. J22R133]|uniref:2-oxo-4-hydroxy-4-carboxy-5-ureidoimidazoline decarboxylase n=1 Tax=Variovorax brevis TaxID=3053503 RepID=UPI002578B894|nr:2-oxo-4-hydroxy-4-carboxy-5-ureidoimidazoline decarboxylase [Variovorax sp. J22R133]MDM0110641.1 2-oxo-4-hydroxy-4-carboxy-5-ureidoimidazoline decarboxylase [Variovorax sp. J22R133]
MSAVLKEQPASNLRGINNLDKPDFVAALGGVFEHSAWVASQAWHARPFATIDALHDAMIRSVRSADRGVQLAFLRGHPELAGKEAQAGTMTDHSTAEQAGLNALSHEEMRSLQWLNAAYAAKHGFPFIIAVLANTKSQIFQALHTRLDNETEDELVAAIDQIAIITRLRLGRLLGAP